MEEAETEEELTGKVERKEELTKRSRCEKGEKQRVKLRVWICETK